MNPIEILLTLQQVENIYKIHHVFGKAIDLEMQECYNTCAFREEAMSGSLRIFPPWLQKVYKRIKE
jgi:hypothetical protein